MKLFSISIITVLITINVTTVFAQKNSIFPEGKKAPNIHHTGDVWLNHLSVGDSIFNYNIAIAKFAVGAKLDWHFHPKGQQLIIIDGVGYYQERGKPVQIVQKGDIVKCQPNVEHWHAATPKTGVTYLAITGNQKTVWKENITQTQFKNIDFDSISKKVSEQDIIKLSAAKWRWMSEKNIESLKDIFHDSSVFVHMGGSWGKDKELQVIASGDIHYKKVDIHEVSINVIEDTAILLNKITLLAVVGGNEVTNSFMVTEVYKQEHDNWKIASLSFTKLMSK